MPDDAERLVVLLEARIRDFEKNMQKAAGTADQSYGRMRRDSKSATAQMEADMLRSTSRINQALAGASLKIGAYGKAFAAGLIGSVTAVGVDGVVRAVRGLVREVASLGDEAARAGVSVKVFQEWKAVATATRVPLDAMVDAFKELSIRADEFAATGKGSAAEAFGRLGMSREDVKEKLRDPAKLMVELIDRTRQLKNAAAATRIFDEMFGGTGAEQLVRLLGLADGEIGKIIQSAHDAGAILDEEMIRKADEMDRRWNAAWTNFEMGAKAAIFNSIDFMTQLERKMMETGNAIGNSGLFTRLAQMLAQSGMASSDVTLIPGQLEKFTSQANVKELEQRATLLEKQIANLRELGFDAADAVRELAAVRAQLEAEVQAILGSAGRGTIGEIEITLPEIEVSRELASATKFMEEYRKQLALSVRDRSIAAETQRILNQASSEGVQITEEQARALATEKEARDEREAATKRNIATLEKETEVMKRRAEELRQFEDDLIFEREQMFRSPIDQRVYAELRSVGLDINSIEGERAATYIRQNELLAEQIDLAQQLGDALSDAASNFLQDIFSGRDALESIVNLGRRFASTNFDAFVDSVAGIFGGGAKVQVSAPSAASRPVEVTLSPKSATSVQRAGNAFLDLIGRAEGTDRGRGYNETLAYGRFTGGPRNLIGMTLDQIDALQTSMLRHTENTFNSSAVGRYQIVRQTLRGLREEFNLGGDDLFTPKLQDELALQLARARGANAGGLKNEWAGLGPYSSQTIIEAYREGVQGQAKAVFEAARTGTQQGSQTGASKGVETGVLKLGDMASDMPSAAGQGGAFGMQGAMGLLSAGLGGFSTGYSSANPLMGALGGAMQGMGAVGQLAALGITISPVIGAVVGGAGGRIGAILNGART